MIRRFSLSALLAATLALCACGGSGDGEFDVAFMDSEQNLFTGGTRLSPAGQQVRAAIRSGLVALDQNGEVVPSLADRWNVTEGGRIFVFRLRDGTWPDGKELTAQSVQQALTRAIRSLRGTSLGLDLSPIDEIRPMAGRVLEIRLAGAMPDLLLLLAQPELGLTNVNVAGGGNIDAEDETGPMVLTREDGQTLLSFKSPTQRGQPEDEDWREHVRDIRLHAFTPAQAIAAFEEGDIEVVLGGRLEWLPLADTGPLSRGTVRLDPAIGLFGLQARRSSGVLQTAELREAVSMAIDRQALAGTFNVGGWVPTTRLVAPGLANDPGLVGERWGDLTIEQRRAVAATRIANWRATLESGDQAQALTLSLHLADAPGHALLFDELRSQLSLIGVALVQADRAASADLALVDRVARYGAPLWFLNQFNCLLDRGLCSQDADVLAGQTLDENDPVNRARLLGEAEAVMTAENIYIPIGSPLRWSLVRGNVDGFSGNRWGFHPLPDMAVIPR